MGEGGWGSAFIGASVKTAMHSRADILSDVVRAHTRARRISRRPPSLKKKKKRKPT